MIYVYIHLYIYDARRAHETCNSVEVELPQQVISARSVSFIPSLANTSTPQCFLTPSGAVKPTGPFSTRQISYPQISSGTFESNKAHHGGFLYKEGNGPASCKGSAIVGHQARAGGAIYAEGGNLHWECDLSNNVAFIGSAMYGPAKRLYRVVRVTPGAEWFKPVFKCTVCIENTVSESVSSFPRIAGGVRYNPDLRKHSCVRRSCTTREFSF